MKSSLVVKLIVAIIRLCTFEALFLIVKEAGALAIIHFDSGFNEKSYLVLEAAMSCNVRSPP
jgi:hypothetical protein